MQTVGEFLTECGRSLAPFDRARVGRTGCFTASAAIVAALVFLMMGGHDTGGSFAAGFRFTVLCAIGTVIALFVGYAVVETLVERSVRRRVESYLRESGTDLETLTRAATMRSGHIPGGARIAALLARHRS